MNNTDFSIKKLNVKLAPTSSNYIKTLKSSILYTARKLIMNLPVILSVDSSYVEVVAPKRELVLVLLWVDGLLGDSTGIMTASPTFPLLSLDVTDELRPRRVWPCSVTIWKSVRC